MFFFYAAGLGASYYIELSGKFVIILFAATAASIVLIALPLNIFRRYDLNWIFGVAVSIVFFVSGLIHNEIERITQNNAMNMYSKECYYQVRVLEQPEIRSKTLKVTTRIIGEIVNDTLKKNKYKAILYIEKDTASLKLVPGSEMIIRAVFEEIPGIKNPGEFSYRKYLANRRIYLQEYLTAGNWCLYSEKTVMNMKTIAENLRQKLLNQYRRLGLNQVELGTLSALTLGYKHDLDSQTKNYFKKAGVMHVLALSGFHVGAITLLLGLILGWTGGSVPGSIIRILISIVVLWGFAIVTGLSASVTRATAMLSFLMIGKYLGRKVNTYNILFITAFCMLVMSPGLITDASFQLSFLAVTGILLFHPLLTRTVKIKNRIMDKIWQMFTISCAAQLAVFPVTIFYFHQFPLFFWITNLYVVPMVAVIIYLSAGYLLFSFIMPLGWIFGNLLKWTVTGLLHGVAVVEMVPNALIDGMYISSLQVLLLLLTIFCFGLFISLRIKKFMFAGLFIFIAFLLSGIRHDSELKKQNQVIINSLNGISSVNLISGHQNLLLVDPDSLITPASIMYSFSNYWIERGVHDKIRILNIYDPFLTNSADFQGLYIRQNFLGSNIFLKFYEISMVILKSNEYNKILTKGRCMTDLLVISGSVYPDMGKILQMFDFECLIIDSSVKHYIARQWINACKSSDVCYWSVTEQGAFLIKALSKPSL